ncbi:trimeric intracellular cation channel family protein [Actinomadura fibrosa]|uniref:Trimeric intracellular cation channel family protein n=1 Tax=Actinomadura fibrosa TaxID=111802 RepID=A0ABW2XJL3_9ACTN|nr:TRIC cation channel family protein [Actinomadura fibrosa]
MRIETITTALDLTGVFINGLLGGAVARNRELDLFGYVVLGLVSGLGGGLIRDTLLQQGPPVALTNSLYIPAALAGGALAFLLSFTEQDWNRLFSLLDAVALSVWAVAGAEKTLAAGLGWLPAVLLGTVTAVGGGAARDLLLQRVPSVFGGNALYASVAMLVAAVQVASSRLGAPAAGTVLGVLAGTVLRVIAYRRQWRLPNGAGWEARDALGRVVRSPWPSRRRDGHGDDGDRDGGDRDGPGGG